MQPGCRDASSASTISMDEARKRALFVLGIGLFAISWAAILVRLCEAPAMIVAFYRLALSAAILAPLCFFSGGSRDASQWRENWGWMVLSGLFLASHFQCWIEAVQTAPVALAVTLSSTHPIIVGVLSRVIYRKALGMSRAVGTFLTVGAVAAMMWDPGGWNYRELEGLLFASGAAFFFALYMMVGHRVRARMCMLSYVVPTYGAAGLFLMIASIVEGMDFLGYSSRTMAMFFLLALIPTVIGHSSLNWALGHLSPTIVALSVLAEPVGASILAWAILGERLEGRVILWGWVILCGIYLASRGEFSNRRGGGP